MRHGATPRCSWPGRCRHYCTTTQHRRPLLHFCCNTHQQGRRKKATYQAQERSKTAMHQQWRPATPTLSSQNCCCASCAHAVHSCTPSNANFGQWKPSAFARSSAPSCAWTTAPVCGASGPAPCAQPCRPAGWLLALPWTPPFSQPDPLSAHQQLHCNLRHRGRPGHWLSAFPREHSGSHASPYQSRRLRADGEAAGGRHEQIAAAANHAREKMRRSRGPPR